MPTQKNTRKAEAETSGTVVVPFRGVNLTLIKDYAEWPLDLHEALEDGRDIAALRAGLGPEQWAIVKGMGLKTDGLAELFGACADAWGFKTAGEFTASSD